MIQLVDDGYHYSQAVRAGDYFIIKLKFLLYGHVMYNFNRLGPNYATRRLHIEFFFIKVHFITTTRPISIF